jgi:hypothetical protein
LSDAGVSEHPFRGERECDPEDVVVAFADADNVAVLETGQRSGDGEA